MMRENRLLQAPEKDHRTVKVKDNVERNLKLENLNLKNRKSIRKDSIDISAFSEVSEVSEDNLEVEFTESSITSLSPFDSPSSVHLPSSLITPLSAATAELSVNGHGSLLPDSKVAGSLDVELVVKHLQLLMLHSLNSTDTDLRFKKLLNALINVIIEDFCSSPEERDRLTAVIPMRRTMKDRLSDLISRRSLMVFLSLIFWLLVVSTMLCFSKFTQSSSSGPPPT